MTNLTKRQYMTRCACRPAALRSPQNMYQNPVLNAPLGPDGLPVKVDPKRVQEFFEVRECE